MINRIPDLLTDLQPGELVKKTWPKRMYGSPPLGIIIKVTDRQKCEILWLLDDFSNNKRWIEKGAYIIGLERANGV